MPRFRKTRRCRREAHLRATLSALLLITACAANKDAPSDAIPPVPVLEDRALANCTFDRLGTVLEERTGVIINPQSEVPRTLGRKARKLGADAIIEMKLLPIVPMNASDAGRSRANGLRASAVAIKFTSPTCAENLKSNQKSSLLPRQG